MWARLGLVALVASCYSGHAASGAPCTPALANCPQGQSCALVSGDYICIEGAAVDAAQDGSSSDAVVDAAKPVDAGIDAAPLAPWTLVQTAGGTASSLAITASGGGHLIVVAVETTAIGPVTSVSDSAGNTYVAAVGGRSASATFGAGLELWYAAGAKPGATTVTATAPTVYAMVIWEVAGIRTTSPVDRVTKLDDQAATTLPVGASITTTAAGDYVVSVAIVDNTVSGIHAGNAFTNDRTTFGNGWAHLTSNSAAAGTYQARWDQPTSGAYCATSVAFFIGP